MWQPSCQNLGKEFNSDFGNGLEEKKKKELWQWNCRNLREEFSSNFGNEVAENEGKKNFVAAKFRNWRKEDLGRKL